MSYPDMEAEYLTGITTSPGLSEVLTALIKLGETRRLRDRSIKERNTS
jgi:hypothetical protein